MPLERYKEKEEFVCIYNGGAYAARIQSVHEKPDSEGFYIVHYQGWAKRFDEKIRFEEQEDRMFPGTLTDYHAKFGVPNDPKSKKAPKRKSTVARYASSDDESAPSAKTTKKSTKRKRFPYPTVSTNFELPPALATMLVDDYTAIRKGFVSKIPAEHSIDRIITDYIKTLPAKNADLENIDDVVIEYDSTDIRITNLAMICTARGVADYFNAVCGSSVQLLYHQERHQHLELIRMKALEMNLPAHAATNTVVDRGFRHSQEYGIIHLVRLLSKLPELLAHTDWEHRILSRIMTGIRDLVGFLDKNRSHYHKGAEMYESSAKAKVELCEKEEKSEKLAKKSRKSAKNEQSAVEIRF
ncbi:Protein CBR-MRG-1 [Caenorhabditis briggsae]|uniref:MRG domain-containing protein n=2 Tax=Caenorhabditis briggsae TaxID=6238 RepID=A0AAE9D8Y8_CAEBR|nr:Protein CBR-MRG-1 [Caenorhabditis briggsae]ULT98818.1 hypothetical protein L3Y34_000283 [Caenorhabditis briggsae]CAP33940.2 Protein CBR-MRG-1 [Caenorhabditis briggsae]